MVAVTKKLTYADYEKIPADSHRHEIIDGEWFMTPAPNLDHQTVVVNLTALLRDYVAGRKMGRVFVAPTDVVLSKNDIVQPDVLFVSKERLSVLGSRNLQGAPDLVVEVVSPSTAAIDRGVKLGLYDRGGVREYWIVDPSGKTVEIHEFGSPRRVRVYKEGESFGSALLSGLTICLDEIFST